MSTFIIRNKTTLEQWVASSGKSSWKKPNHAKAAFANSLCMKNDPLLKEYVDNLGKYESLKFNDQDIYECIEVYSDAAKRSANIERALEEVFDKLTNLKSALARCESLDLEDYDYLYSEVEEMQHIAMNGLEEWNETTLHKNHPLPR